MLAAMANAGRAGVRSRCRCCLTALLGLQSVLSPLPANSVLGVLHDDAGLGKLLTNGVGVGEVPSLFCGVALFDQAIDLIIGDPAGRQPGAWSPRSGPCAD